MKFAVLDKRQTTNLFVWYHKILICIGTIDMLASFLFKAVAKVLAGK